MSHDVAVRAYAYIYMKGEQIYKIRVTRDLFTSKLDTDPYKKTHCERLSE